MKTLRRLAADTRASAATEMALVMPLLLLLMLGSFEVGNYFLAEHVVQKGVRDAARYASRLSITNYPSCTATGAAELQIQRVAKTGDPDGDADGDGNQDVRILGWTDDNMTTVSLNCTPLVSGTDAGIYSVYPFPDGIPVVTVSASVPYTSLLSTIGLGNPSLTLNADSQAAIFAQ